MNIAVYRTQEPQALDLLRDVARAYSSCVANPNSVACRSTQIQYFLPDCVIAMNLPRTYLQATGFYVAALGPDLAQLLWYMGLYSSLHKFKS